MILRFPHPFPVGCFEARKVSQTTHRTTSLTPPPSAPPCAVSVPVIVLTLVQTDEHPQPQSPSLLRPRLSKRCPGVVWRDLAWHGPSYSQTWLVTNYTNNTSTEVHPKVCFCESYRFFIVQNDYFSQLYHKDAGNEGPITLKPGVFYLLPYPHVAPPPPTTTPSPLRSSIYDI